jgi:hypothetical protein
MLLSFRGRWVSRDSNRYDVNLRVAGSDGLTLESMFAVV